MTDLMFYGFVDYEDGKIAHFETSENEIPINVFIDNYEDVADFPEGTTCRMDIFAISGDVKVFKTEESLRASGSSLAPIAMIPMGTFSVKPCDPDFTPSPHILFSGYVRNVEPNPSPEENTPNYCIFIETLDFHFSLYMDFDGRIEEGDIISGVAWLFGEIVANDTQN